MYDPAVMAPKNTIRWNEECPRTDLGEYRDLDRDCDANHADDSRKIRREQDVA